MDKNVFLAVLIAGVILASGCVQQQNAAGKGVLQGTISIGPLCPVERIPPDPACKPAEETFNAWPIAVYDSGKTKITEIKPDANGYYEIELPAGEYIVDLEKEHQFGSNLPAEVTINANETAALDIDIDTGIR
ncbi:MAG: hypothetical protein V1834_04245 [Candidatus Micrarchaeota archaeon]